MEEVKPVDQISARCSASGGSFILEQRMESFLYAQSLFIFIPVVQQIEREIADLEVTGASPVGDVVDGDALLRQLLSDEI
jgi:hypothetical protein